MWFMIVGNITQNPVPLYDDLRMFIKNILAFEPPKLQASKPLYKIP